MKRKVFFFAILAMGGILISQIANASTSSPHQGGIETVIPFALSTKSIEIPLFFGFWTSFVIMVVSSSIKKTRSDRQRFLSTLFTDFWFEGFITPGLGTILLFISYSFFWGWIYFLIWSTFGGFITFNAFWLSALGGLIIYVALRALIESLVSITKTAESANAIIRNLNRVDIKDHPNPELLTHVTNNNDTPVSPIDRQKDVEALIDKYPELY
jgi:hypothetical protein